MPILLKDAIYVNWQDLSFQECNIFINKFLDPPISILKLSDELDFDDTEIIDCKGKIVTRSFVNAHHHVYSALARGMGAPKQTPHNFYEILKYVWWQLDKALDKDMIKASALATALECAKNGVSFVIDHHSSPNAIEGSLDIIKSAFEEIGISHLLCFEISDRDGDMVTEKAFHETEEYLKTNQALVGLHAAFTVGDKTLQKAVDLADKYQSGIHIHTAEDAYDQEYNLQKHKKRVVERIKEAGVLCFEKSILAHCIHINDFERDLLNNSDAWIVQNPDSNLNNKVGFFNGNGLESKKIMLGTDGMHSNMLKSLNTAFFAGQQHDKISLEGAYQRLRNVHNYLSSNSFKGDAEDNLVILDYDSPTEINSNNFIGHLLFGIENRHITDVISNGEFILRNKKLVKINEEEILNFSREQANRLWKKMKE